MPRLESLRNEIHRLIRAAPFRSSAITLENGDRAIIEHPENTLHVLGRIGWE
jgi:hypothetical protein